MTTPPSDGVRAEDARTDRDGARRRAPRSSDPVRAGGDFMRGVAGASRNRRGSSLAHDPLVALGFVRTIARTAERRHAGGVIGRDTSRRGPSPPTNRPDEAERPAGAARRERAGGQERRAGRRPHHPLDVADVLHAHAARTPRRASASHSSTSAAVSVSLSGSTSAVAADAEIDRRRAALAVVERLRALERRRDPRRCSRSGAARAAAAGAAATRRVSSHQSAP